FPVNPIMCTPHLPTLPAIGFPLEWRDIVQVDDEPAIIPHHGHDDFPRAFLDAIPLGIFGRRCLPPSRVPSHPAPAVDGIRRRRKGGVVFLVVRPACHAATSTGAALATSRANASPQRWHVAWKSSDATRHITPHGQAHLRSLEPDPFPLDLPPLVPMP